MVSSFARASIATGLGTLPQELSLAVSAVAARLPHTLLVTLLTVFSAAVYTSTLPTLPAAAARGGSSGGCWSSTRKVGANSEAESGDVRALSCCISCSEFRMWA